MGTLRNLPGSSEEARVRFDSQGHLRHLGAPPGAAFRLSGTGSVPEATARAFVASCDALLGVADPLFDFTLDRTRSTSGGRTAVRLQQTFGGIPVFGAMASVQLDAGSGVESLLADLAHDAGGLRRALERAASVRPAQETVAATRAAHPHGARMEATTEPELLIFAPEVLGASGEPVLVWEFEVRGGDPESDRRFLVDAVRGAVVRDYPLCETALNRAIYDSDNTSDDPGTLVRSEGQGPSGIADADNAYAFLGDTYAFYSDNHGRDGIDGTGSALSATVRYCDPSSPCPYGNAFWDGSRMYFGEGFTVDDVTGHELTHGVTQHESGLIYENHSGAINESFSDLWGEFIDLGNGVGNDSAGVRWLLGEDGATGAFRSLKNPPTFGHPDRLGSPLFIPPVAMPDRTNDHGGVHTNSGVNNKLAFLLTDGGSFNGQTIASMGIPLVADLYYETQVGLLTPASDYADLYDALQQAAVNIGLSVQQRDNVQRACAAVEIGTIGRYVFVDLANAGSENGSAAHPYNTVAEGLAALQPGDHLCIQSGSYDEQPTMSTLSQVLALGGPVLLGQ